jgi:aryl-alcohol dehydrogenase-like predicted oxidoreductase
MNKRLFGSTNWEVTAMGLGCWQYGGAITIDGAADGWAGIQDEESLATIRQAATGGINFFDTADMYGWGHSEEILGRALRDLLPSLGGRDQVHIASKVGFWHDETYRRTFGESREYILQACDASLRRLQTDYLDLYQCHLGRTERWTEFLDAFELLRRQGKIREFGISTNDLDMVEKFNERGTLGSVQANFNLIDRKPASTLLPYCRKHNIAFIGRGPLAMGKLTGKYNRHTVFDPEDIRSKWLTGTHRAAYERDIQIAERLLPLATAWNISLADLAIRYVLDHEGVSVVIPGARNRSQLQHNLRAASLPPLTTKQLDLIHRELQS